MFNKRRDITSLGSLFNYSFFITQNMKSQLREGPIFGTLPILYVFLARTGKTVHELNFVSLDEQGNLQVADSVAGPTRNAAPGVTGRYAMRYGLQTLVIFPSHTFGLPTDERTLAQALKDVGYQTAMVGKWHLGHADRKYWPQNRGFDHFYGNLVGEVDYFTKERGGIVDWQRNGKFLKEDGYFTTLIGNEAVDIIKEHDTAKPLFLYVASLAPHAPYQAPQKDIDAYKNTAGDVHRHTLCRHDHRSGHSGRSDRRRAEAAEHGRQHAHHVQQRQWRRHERVVCNRGTVT
jgi:arylsulfatase A-like enzyme